MGDFQANFARPIDTGIYTAEGNVAGSRAAQLEKKRQRDQEAFEERKRAVIAENKKASTNIHSKFAGAAVVTTESSSFQSQTIGLVTAEEFKKLSQEAAVLEKNPGSSKLRGASGASETAENESEEARVAREKAEKKARKSKLKEKKKVLAKLSFAGDEEAAEDDDDGEYIGPLHSKEKKKISSKKDPTVDTSFLPDKERDETLAAERARLEQQWLEQQEAVKRQDLEITYSYWDGSGHRRTVVVKKGDSIGTFLEKVRVDSCKDFREMQSVSSDGLLYVKEDLILPHDLTFYDLIVTKARGKSGPLFHFDVHEDVRLNPIDTRVEKDESHPGKVVQRAWYERNKHIFPASRWELFDPAKEYGKYTIHGGEVNKKTKK